MWREGSGLSVGRILVLAGLLAVAAGPGCRGHGSEGDDRPVLVAGPDAFTTNFEDISGVRWIFEDSAKACPDGLAGRFHVVSDDERTKNAPLVIALHGGAFDYVDPEGNHHAKLDKLNRPWSECKLRDFLGEPAPECADPEANGGAIVAALIERGAVVLLPSNCYGDLWHGSGRVDPDDGFARWGLRLTQDAAAFVADEFETSPALRFAWGTSAGGHGIAELVVAGEPLERILSDSPGDYLPGAAEADAQAYPEIQEGFRRIFEGDGSAEHVGRFSLRHAVGEAGFADPVLYLFSCNDTELPPPVTEPAARAILEKHPEASSCCVLHARDPGEPGGPDITGHVFTNGRIEVSRAGAAWLFDGQRPPGCETEFTPCP